MCLAPESRQCVLFSSDLKAGVVQEGELLGKGVLVYVVSVTLIPESYFRRWASLVDVDEVNETTLPPRNSDSMDSQFLDFAFWRRAPDRRESRPVVTAHTEEDANTHLAVI